MGDFVQVERQGAVTLLRLHRPDTLNSVATHEDCADLVSAIVALP